MQLSKLAKELGKTPSIVPGWGLSTQSEAVVVQPTSVEEVADVFRFAMENHVPVGFRGTGCSYGDASQNLGGIVVDTTKFNRIKSLDPETGVLVAEPGVTLENIWRRSIPLAYWPPVVSGTMFPTLGGLLSMNIHGKNNWRAGTIGNHVLSFRMLTMRGEELTCSRDENSELFHAAIGGFGMLGCFTEITLQLKKVHSGYLDVEAIATPHLRDMICFFEQNKDDYDYLVGWIDCFAKGRSLGRGQIHAANYLAEGVDPNPAVGLTEAAQDLPTKLFKIIPKSSMWRFMRPFLNDIGWRLMCAAKYRQSVRHQTRGKPHRQPHAAFAFLLDYVPDWKKGYGAGGLIQYQTFVPRDTAADTHCKLLELCHEARFYPYLGVYKRHREDPFLMTHAVNGFSFAMDFKVTHSNRRRLWDLTHRMDEILVAAGGKLYFAKDATMLSGTGHRIWPEAVLGKLRALKIAHDPEGLLQTNLSRRVFPELTAAEVAETGPSAAGGRSSA